MILSAHQPAYLPWGGWYDKINRADHFVILDDVQFERGSFTNRNKITIDGLDVWLTIPVERGHLSDKIREKKIIKNGWCEYHLLKIREAYEGSQGWEKYWPAVSEYVENCYACDTLGDLPILMPELIPGKTPLNQSWIGVGGNKLDMVINLCKHFDCDTFLFGELGRDYCDEEYLASYGIKAIFQDWTGSKMSIIDALFKGEI